MHLIGFLIMGAIVGWLAGKIMSGHGYGIIWDIVLGVVGSFVGGLIFSLIFGTQPTGLVISFIVALIGAVVLVAIVHMVRREPVRTVCGHPRRQIAAGSVTSSDVALGANDRK